jgi:phosphoglycerate dehydrogenase-like enzyme
MHLLIIFPANDEHRQRISTLVPGWTLTFCKNQEVTPEIISQADVILGNVAPTMLQYAHNLKWIQLSSAGYHEYVVEGVLPQHVRLTNSVGAFGLSVSEHLLAMLFALYKNFPYYRDAQNKNNWIRPLQNLSIEGSTILIVGLGDTGSQFARKVHALGARVIGVRRSIQGTKPAYVDELYESSQLDQVLPLADTVAICLPGTTVTEGLFSASRIACMKKQAFLLNVGRGSIVDTQALIDALENGHLAGAALDVFTTEPLPSDSPLWNIPQVLITPHTAGGFHLPATVDSIVRIALTNLSFFINGQPLENEIDRASKEKVIHDDSN